MIYFHCHLIDGWQRFMCGCVHPYTFAYKHNHLAGGTVIGHSKQGANKVILGHRNIKVEPKGGEKPNLFGIQTQCLSINLPNIHYLRGLSKYKVSINSIKSSWSPEYKILYGLLVFQKYWTFGRVWAAC